MTYRWICPYCFDDHAENALCRVDNLKIQIDSLRLQLEFAQMQEDQRRLQPAGWLCAGCGEREKAR